MRSRGMIDRRVYAAVSGVSLLVCAGLGVAAYVSGGDGAGARGGMSADRLAAVVERIDQERLVGSMATSAAATVTAAETLRAVGLEDPAPQVVASVAAYVDGVDAAAARLRSGGGVEVTDVDVSVREETVEGAVRVVTLHVARTLEDGQVWGALTPFAVVDRSDDASGLAAGQVYALDRESAESGRLPEVLHELADVHPDG